MLQWSKILSKFSESALSDIKIVLCQQVHLFTTYIIHNDSVPQTIGMKTKATSDTSVMCYKNKDLLLRESLFMLS